MRRRKENYRVGKNSLEIFEMKILLVIVKILKRGNGDLSKKKNS